MDEFEHLKLPVFAGSLERHKIGFSKYVMPLGRNKNNFSQNAKEKATQLSSSFAAIKEKFSGKINPSLIYEIEINQSVHPESFERILSSMDIHILSVVEGKKGYWIVFSDDEQLQKFNEKLEIYGSLEGANYDFFNAIDSFQDIPIEKKIGQNLKEKPFVADANLEFLDIELWKMVNPRKNQDFIQELEDSFNDRSQFRITDRLVTKSIVLLRVKISKFIFDEIIELKEIARIDRPSLPSFNPVEYFHPNISDIKFEKPNNDATGILIIDSGIVSNHPMLENCIGDERNYQDGENSVSDTVGHGTAVSGCATYGNIEKCIEEQCFMPSNWIFSAKVMYAEKDFNGNIINATYDPEKLIEHQFKNAVEEYLINTEYRIKVVNISIGNSNEVWHKHYYRQLPLAAIIDELAIVFSDVVFIVSSGNQNPLKFNYETIADVLDNYPDFLINNVNFKIINPATAALAFTIGSIAPSLRIETERYGSESIITPIAEENQPSPFSRTGLGINGMIKPELVEYGGNILLKEQYGRISEDRGGKIGLLNNSTTDNLLKFDCGTSFSAPKVAHLAGELANLYPLKSSNFIKNMMLVGAEYPFIPTKYFYNTKNKKDAEKMHLSTCGFGLSSLNRAVHSYENRTVLWDENRIKLDDVKVYSLQLPKIFFEEKGKKKITIVLTYNPETRPTRGDSYIGNVLEFHLFHSISPAILVEKYAVISQGSEVEGVPDTIKKFEIDLFPGSNTRKAGCHQKSWKEYKREPENIPQDTLSLVLLSKNKWMTNKEHQQDYCISVILEHENEIDIYNAIRTNIQMRTRVR